jgi:hypothetical protein
MELKIPREKVANYTGALHNAILRLEKTGESPMVTEGLKGLMVYLQVIWKDDVRALMDEDQEWVDTLNRELPKPKSPKD